MKRTIDIISISTVGQIPTIETIRAIPRERILKLVFDNSIQRERETIGRNLKKELIGFQVGIHTIEPEINIAKLITDQEIEDNQDFFEQCAKDYRKLGEELIFELAGKLAITIDPVYPLLTFNELRRDNRHVGKINNWRYNLHGIHCGFENHKTGQKIEVPLAFGLEFGDLDPYFFTRFIKSTSNYKPLPVSIFEDYADGVRINEKMISLGKFERLCSKIGNHHGIVVKDRPKVEIKPYEELNRLHENQNTKDEKLKFNFWKFVGLKK